MKTDIQKLYEAYLSCTAGVCTDTRNITPACLFVALKGANFDANATPIVREALDKGASYVLTSNAEFEHDRRAFVVPDTLEALQDLARKHRSHLQCPVVGITGTNGKTTTKELVTAVLARKFRTYATKGNLNNHIGVPLTLLSIPPDAEMAVVEMGANHPGEIAFLCTISRPTAGLVTNVGMAHIEGFGSFEGVKATKAELYASLRSASGTIFIDPNNPHLAQMLGNYDKRVEYADGVADPDSETLCLTATVGGQTMCASTKLTGAYNLPNALAATTVGAFYGLTAHDIAAALEEYTPSNGRSQIVQTERNRVVLDAYNANPASMAAALDNFQKAKAPRKAVILGAMRELGSEELPQHQAVVERLATMGLEKAVLIGPEFAPFKESHPEFLYLDQTPQAEEAARQMEGLYILVKGSNSNKLATLVPSL